MVGFEELPNGRYGTSIPMSLAMDPSNDVLISWQMNGIHLTPDHGYPLRIIIPGWIGGRMIKWVTNITVTEEPSDNYYHFFDNRIMPPHVDAELAKVRAVWIVLRHRNLLRAASLLNSYLFPILQQKTPRWCEGTETRLLSQCTPAVSTTWCGSASSWKGPTHAAAKPASGPPLTTLKAHGMGMHFPCCSLSRWLTPKNTNCQSFSTKGGFRVTVIRPWGTEVQT